MENYPKVILKSGKDLAIERFHPWVFSGAIKKIIGYPNDGDLVSVYSNKDKFLALGHYQQGSITVRVLSFEQTSIDGDFWLKKVKAAFRLRYDIGLADHPQLNAYRLIHAEGDGMPGLIIDFYNGTAVMQCHSIGMHQNRNEIAEALKAVYLGNLKAIYDKSAETLPSEYGKKVNNGFLFKEFEPSGFINEYENLFTVNWEKGQKTGFFIDQRENRALLKQYARNRTILNTFCYTGGFTVAALRGGAKLVHSVDSSKKAIELSEQNIELNDFSKDIHQCFASDALDYLKGLEQKYDIIVLDPPAYAKHQNVRHNAVQGYKRLNREALKHINKGGLLFTFSCSQVVNKQLFTSTFISAAIQAGRKVRIIHQLTQPADHPINAFHPESEYLKGLVAYVE